MWQRTSSPKLNELPPLEKNLNDFKALLRRQTPEFPVKENPNSKIVLKIESLNKPFDVKEIKCAPRKIKLNKAPVVDSLTSEMKKCHKYNLLNELKKIFNTVSDSGYYQENWNHGMICTTLPSGTYVTFYLRDCSHFERRENKRHLSCGFP